MRMSLLIAGICLPALTGPLIAQDLVPDYFEITDVMVNGGGCTPGSIEKNVAADKLSFSLSFRDYIAEVGPNLSLSDGRKSCQLTITLKVPPGWRFAVAAFDYWGYMTLDEGISAEHKTSYYFQANDKQGEFTNIRSGPVQNDFHFAQQVKLNDKIWSPCESKRSLNIKSSLRVWNIDRTKFPNATGVMGTDSILGEFHDQQWKLSWGRCP